MRRLLMTALLLPSVALAEMSSSVNLADPMSRAGSGTSWLPDASPVYAHMQMMDDGMLMLHGTMFPRWTHIGGSRDVSSSGDGGNSKFDAPSMFMAMYSLSLSDDSQLGLNVMASLDPLIEGSEGYPLLYQSGETHAGAALHDRQHPHDFISELAATYSHSLGESQSAYLYVGYPGEPALGPPAFMHRPSAMDGPDAPIGHHWEDATHISWGVTTLGYSVGTWKIEASAFRGREPDEQRYNFESVRLDSWSTRLSWNPTDMLALQVSHGFLHAPETLEPDADLRRTTASLLWTVPVSENAAWSGSLVWGRNDLDHEGASNAWLLENAYTWTANTVYSRLERVVKSAHELVLPGDEMYFVKTASLGYVREVYQDGVLDVGLGGQLSFGLNNDDLASVYGGTEHWGTQIFLRIRPSKLQ